MPEYRKRSDVVNVRDERERKVLLGVHDRDYSNGNLAKQPSRLDYETLNKAYSNKVKVYGFHLLGFGIGCLISACTT